MKKNNVLKGMVKRKGSQRKAADEMGISLRTLERILSGQDVRASYLNAVAKYLEISIDDVVSLATENPT